MTKNHGIGLGPGLEDHWPWLWPLPQVSCKLQLAVRTKGPRPFLGIRWST